MEKVCDLSGGISDLGKRICQIRENRGETQEEFLKSLFPGEKRSNKKVSFWENGASAPKPDELARIAQLGGVSLDWLLTGKEYTPPVDIEKRFTLRDICTAFAQAAFLCDMSIRRSKDKEGRPLMVLSIPAYSLDDSHLIEENFSFSVIYEFLLALSSVVTVDITNNAFANKNYDLAPIHLGYAKPESFRVSPVSKLEGIPNTIPARRLLRDYLQNIPALTPYAYYFSQSYTEKDFEILIKLPDSEQEETDLWKELEELNRQNNQ